MEEYDEIKKMVMARLDLSRELEDDEVMEIIAEVIFQYSSDNYISMGEKNEIGRRLFNALRKLDVLQELVDNHEITEIMINGPDHIFI